MRQWYEISENSPFLHVTLTYDFISVTGPVVFGLCIVKILVVVQ